MEAKLAFLGHALMENRCCDRQAQDEQKRKDRAVARVRVPE
jgi:hypothetical protein